MLVIVSKGCWFGYWLARLPDWLIVCRIARYSDWFDSGRRRRRSASLVGSSNDLQLCSQEMGTSLTATATS